MTTSLELANQETTKEKLGEILKQMGDIDKGVAAEIQALIDNGQFDAATEKINSLPGKHTVLIGVASDGSGVTLNANNGGSFRLQYREAGGPVMAGVPYVVGEKRPELFVPDVPGYVLPSVPESFGDTGGIGRGIGGGVHIGQLAVHNDVDADGFFRMAAFHMAAAS